MWWRAGRKTYTRNSTRKQRFTAMVSWWWQRVGPRRSTRWKCGRETTPFTSATGRRCSSMMTRSRSFVRSTVRLRESWRFLCSKERLCYPVSANPFPPKEGKSSSKLPDWVLGFSFLWILCCRPCSEWNCLLCVCGYVCFNIEWQVSNFPKLKKSFQFETQVTFISMLFISEVERKKKIVFHLVKWFSFCDNHFLILSGTLSGYHLCLMATKLIYEQTLGEV